MVGDKLRGALILLAALAFIACADSTTTTTDDAGTTPGETTPGGGDDTIDIGPTFHADIRPMLDQYCMRCHTEGGQGGLSFEDPALVQTLASVMLDRIESREMPPPAADPNCRDYVGSEYMFVPEAEIARFGEWVEAGTPLGTVEEQPQLDLPVWAELPDADLNLRMPEPYEPRFDDEANPGNEYRCFILEHDSEEPYYITALHPIVDDASLVHHIVIFKQEIKETGAYAPDNYDPNVGVNCIDNMRGLSAGMLAGWAPGMVPVELPSGTGLKVEPNEQLIIQMHYFLPTPEALGRKDRSGYAFRTAETVERELYMFPLGETGSNAFTIPAGDASFTHTSSLELPGFITDDITIYTTFPHMHVLGTGYRGWIDRYEGEEDCIVESQQYDFGNQLTYVLNEPVTVTGGDTVNFSCTWDNSANNPNNFYDPPRDVRYGERTDEEMCFAFTVMEIPAWLLDFL